MLFFSICENGKNSHKNGFKIAVPLPTTVAAGQPEMISFGVVFLNLYFVLAGYSFKEIPPSNRNGQNRLISNFVIKIKVLENP